MVWLFLTGPVPALVRVFGLHATPELIEALQSGFNRTLGNAHVTVAAELPRPDAGFAGSMDTADTWGHGAQPLVTHPPGRLCKALCASLCLRRSRVGPASQRTSLLRAALATSRQSARPAGPPAATSGCCPTRCCCFWRRSARLRSSSQMT
eukprot:jgi/Ulvmu1/4287/UM002_0007.1